MSKSSKFQYLPNLFSCCSKYSYSEEPNGCTKYKYIEENKQNDVNNSIQGYYFWCYGKSSSSIWCINSYCTPTDTINWTSDPLTNTIPSGTNHVYMFTGYTDPQLSLNCADQYYNKAYEYVQTIEGGKIGLCLGGGNQNGSWTLALINKNIDAINNNLFSKYQVLVLDIESGDSGLGTAFCDLLQTAKNSGLTTIVTISHAVPYGFSDYRDLMTYILGCKYLDHISPQLYTQDIGTMNEYISCGSDKDFYWLEFVELLKSNPNYSGNMILPSIFLYNEMIYSKCGGLFYSGGTNSGNPPNFGYNSSGSSCNCEGKQSIYPSEFTVDNGANSFFTLLFGIESIGGAIQWVNGNYMG
jgi:hypothetical protein